MSRRRAWALLVPLVAGCALFQRHAAPPTGSTEVGVASWYGREFHGNRTASGDSFNEQEFSAAHPTLPLGTRARVTNLANGRSVIVRVNDRGPFVRGRVLDVSYAAARDLGMLRRGTTRVRVEVLDDPRRGAVTGRARVRRSAIGRRRAASRRHVAAHPGRSRVMREQEPDQDHDPRDAEKPRDEIPHGSPP